MLRRIIKLVRPEKKYKRPTHDIFCACRKCVRSVTSYVKILKELELENE